MRIRTGFAMLFGMAVGAGGVYLLDPDHGPARRREMAGRARRRALAELRSAAVAGSRQARTMLAEAQRGFVEERAGR